MSPGRTSSRAITVAWCKPYCVQTLLPRQPSRKLAIADADGKAFRIGRHRVFPIGPDQFGEGCEQAGLRQAVAIDAIMPRLRPGLVEIAERSLLLLMIGQRIAGGWKRRWMAHETRQAVCVNQGGTHRTHEVYHAVAGCLGQFFKKG